MTHNQYKDSYSQMPSPLQQPPFLLDTTSLDTEALLLIQKLKNKASRLRRLAFATEQLVEELEGAMNGQG